MTIEEAITKYIVPAIERTWNDKICKEILEALEQEPCEDAISRREAIKMFTYNYKGERIPDYECDNFPVQIPMKLVKERLRELPPVNPQPKTGYWILQPSNKEQGERDFIWWKCSECGQVVYSETEKDRREYHAFCGRCGTKMVEPPERSEE